jgi:hypothetical protein
LCGKNNKEEQGDFVEMKKANFREFLEYKSAVIRKFFG